MCYPAARASCRPPLSRPSTERSNRRHPNQLANSLHVAPPELVSPALAPQEASTGMSELRRDPIVGRWVIISESRSAKPYDFVQQAPPARPPDAFCPFCPGHEDATPPELLAYGRNGGRPDTPGWTTRVVPNKYPALQIEGPLARRGEGLYDRMNGIGAHEVFIEAADHTAELSELPVAHVEQVLRAYRERIVDLKRDVRFRYILVFKNHGEPAGASLEHPHTQLIATPVVPKLVTEELEGMGLHFQLKERCIVCDIIEQETATGRRIVAANERFLAYVPFAPRFPFETWIVPRDHASAFELMPEDAGRALASCLKETLTRLRLALDRPAYNFVIHTAPCKESYLEHFHWHIEIMPKLTKVAGFEWGTGFYINPTPPEIAAERLRDAVAEPV